MIQPHAVWYQLAVACVVALTLAVPEAHAATYVITTLTEDNVANGNCTLREALLAASTDTTHDQCIGDTTADIIILQAVGSYELDDGNISSAARNLTVRGAADHPASAFVVDLGNVQRFLRIHAGSALTLENLTLVDGFGGIRGGAVLAESSSLTLRNVTILGSEADNGGAISFIPFDERHLEIVGSTFALNRALGNQAYGGAVEVSLQGAGSARIVGSHFLDNRIDSASGTTGRYGGGIYLASVGGGAVELRRLRFLGNTITAPSFAVGAGATISVSSTAPFLLEDAWFERNDTIAAGSIAATALELRVSAPSAEIRRLHVLDNAGRPSQPQAMIQVSGSTPAVISDLLVGNGGGSGLLLATVGPSCNAVAGNLTVAGHAGAGLRLSQGACPLRVENSIVFGNGTIAGSNVQVESGSPEISPETLIGVDPSFVDAPAGDFRLGPASLGVDAGDLALSSVGPFDTAHGTRVIGSGLDLGALERGAVFADGFERGDLFAWSHAVE